MVDQSNAFVGVDPVTLQLWLTEAQAALQTLAVGGQPVKIVVATGAGGTHREVTYTRTDMGALNARINDLMVALGLRQHSRRAMRLRFS